MNISLLVRKFLQKYFDRFLDKKFFVDILRREGFDIGEGTIFFSPNTIVIDRERPWMLKIGKYCKITRGVNILTHDYSRSVLRRKYGEVIGEAGQVEIGDNVFIGVNSIILMGSKIGNNVIIGAGSVVSGVIPDNVVAAGNPCRVIRELDEHYQKRKSKQLAEAVLYFKLYKEKYGYYPPENDCGPFFQLFVKRDSIDYSTDIRFNVSGDNRDEFISDFKKTTPIFQSYQEMLNYIDSTNE